MENELVLGLGSKVAVVPPETVKAADSKHVSEQRSRLRPTVAPQKSDSCQSYLAGVVYSQV